MFGIIPADKYRRKIQKRKASDVLRYIIVYAKIYYEFYAQIKAGLLNKTESFSFFFHCIDFSQDKKLVDNVMRKIVQEILYKGYRVKIVPCGTTPYFYEIMFDVGVK